jgi:hypothetical protein
MYSVALNRDTDLYENTYTNCRTDGASCWELMHTKSAESNFHFLKLLFGSFIIQLHQVKLLPVISEINIYSRLVTKMQDKVTTEIRLIYSSGM